MDQALLEEVRALPFKDYCKAFVKIVNKKREVVPFDFNLGQQTFEDMIQERYVAERKPVRAIILKARQIGFCLAPETRVLTADLRWITLDEIEPGTEILAVDEDAPPTRKMRRAVVEAKCNVHEPAFRLVMENGAELIATAPHRFLCRRRGATDTQWRTVDNIRPGDVIRHVTEPWGESSYEDGWLGGFIDGEGCLRRKTGVELAISQVSNDAYHRAVAYLRNRGYSFRDDLDQRESKFGTQDVHRLVLSRSEELFRLIGQARPARFVDGGWWEGQKLPGKGNSWVRVERIEPLGPRRMVDLQTSTGTYIAEGFVSHNSTQSQARMIRGLTLYGNRRGVVVAHELDAAGGLFGMGQSMYARLPEDDTVKPATRYVTRGRNLHFAPAERDAWLKGDLWPDSHYQVDTANEAQGGRSKTYDYLHLSEVAFWQNSIDKLVGLLQTVPDEPHTWIILESTANGTNLFKDEWDKAVRGDSDYLPFFWPWWKEPTYRLELSEAERASFRPGRGAFGEGELELLNPGPIDYFSGEHVPLDLEQLAWRRATIRNKTLGKIDKFQQEYPATPQEAFLASGRHVFDQKRVSQILVSCDVSDPALPTEENPGPIRGGFTTGTTRSSVDRAGHTIDVPTQALWVPEKEWHQEGEWKLWLPRDEQGRPVLEQPKNEPDRDRGGPKRRQFVIAADVSGGRMSEGATDSDWHAVQVIDHRTREQVAEYRSHIDPDLLARQIMLASLFFGYGDRMKMPHVGVEVTGGWGLPVVRRLYFDYGHPFVYIRTRLEGRTESEDDRLGWNTSVATKPILEAAGAELLRAEQDGIKSRDLALEFQTYVRNDKGKTGAEPGRHDDLLIAWLIAQQIATEEALRPDWWGHGRQQRTTTPQRYDLYRR